MSKSGKKNIPPQKEQKREPETTEVENTGNYLRTLRLGKGLSIKDVAEITRISEANLNAIEDQNFSALPAITFTRGLLNIYTDFLGADSKTIVAKFMEERNKDSSSQKRRSRLKQSSKILTPKRLAEPSHISSMTMAGVLFLVITLSFTGYCVYTSWNPFSFLVKENRDMQSVMKSVFPEEKLVQESPPREVTITVPVEQPPRETTTAQPAQKNENVSFIFPDETRAKPEELIVDQKTDSVETRYSVTIHFLEDTSITLTRDDDETVVNEFKAGDVHSWSAESLLTLTFSQPDSAEILVNNSAVNFPEIQDGIYILQIPQDIAELQPDE